MNLEFLRQDWYLVKKLLRRMDLFFQYLPWDASQIHLNSAWAKQNRERWRVWIFQDFRRFLQICLRFNRFNLLRTSSKVLIPYQLSADTFPDKCNWKHISNTESGMTASPNNKSKSLTDFWQSPEEIDCDKAKWDSSLSRVVADDSCGDITATMDRRVFESPLSMAQRYLEA